MRICANDAVAIRHVMRTVDIILLISFTFSIKLKSSCRLAKKNPSGVESPKGLMIMFPVPTGGYNLQLESDAKREWCKSKTQFAKAGYFFGKEISCTCVKAELYSAGVEVIVTEK